MALTDAQIRSFKPENRRVRKSDGGGLFVDVMPSGNKIFRLAYRFNGKQRTLVIGDYPHIRLADSRLRAAEHKQCLQDGIDPQVTKISEEASLLYFPAVMLRDTHERPEGMDEAVLVMCGLQQKYVLNAVETVVAHADRYQRVFRAVQDYQAPVVSKKVVRILLSYTPYVNRTVWSKAA